MVQKYKKIGESLLSFWFFPYFCTKSSINFVVVIRGKATIMLQLLVMDKIEQL